jgi:hypothetical protein
MNEAIDIGRGAAAPRRAMTVAGSWARWREVRKKLFLFIFSAVTL